MPLLPLTTADLTQATLEGAGVFDTLMRANKAHLEAEFTKNRIKGAEYATVYLGSLESVLRASVEFLLQKDKLSLEAQLLEQQIILAQVEVQKANAELAILQQTLLKVPAEIALLGAQTAKIEQDSLHEVAKHPLELAHLTAQNVLLTQQTTNLVAEALNIPIQGQVLFAEKCKLEAEFDVVMLTKAKVTAETGLLGQKAVTEAAQTTTLGVDADSVIGKQKALYAAQTAGFARDAEQKAAKLMADTWAVRRTTDEAVVADAVNKLSDANIGLAIGKMMAGVGV